MAIDPQIPLSGIQFRTQTPEQAISLAHMQQQMAAFDAQQRLAQSREARAQVELKMQQAEARQKASQSQLERAYKAYAGTQGPEETRVAASRKAWLDSIQEMEDTGGAAAIGLSPQELAKARQNIPAPEEMLAKSMSIKDLIERQQYQQSAGGGTVPLANVSKVAAGPTDVVTGQPIPESTAPSGATVRGVDQFKPQGKPVGENEMDPINVIDRAPVETPRSLRQKAVASDVEEKRQLAFGNPIADKRAKEASDKAKEYRAASIALDKEIRESTDLKLVPGAPGVLYNEAERRFERDGKKISAEEVLNVARISQPEMPPEIADFIAKQIWAGDSTAGVGFARNPRAKEAIAEAVVREGQRRGAGGEDLAAKVAEFRGITAGQRTLGNRTAQVGLAIEEAKSMIPLAVDASEKVPRTQFPNLNSVLLAAEKGTGDENVVQFGIAVNSLINIYARAINPTGVPTVSDKEHARELLSTAWTKGQFKSGVEQLQKEMEAARQAPAAVRGEFREAVTGKSEKPAENKGGTYFKGKPKAPIEFTPEEIENEIKRRGLK